MKLSLHTRPEVPLEAEVVSPARLAGLSEAQIGRLVLYHGNRKVELGEFFSVSGSGAERLEVEGDLSAVKLLGSDMEGGSMVINGDVGSHLGAGMSGGSIRVEGNAGDWVGREMSGGRIEISGSAGHMLGSAVRGASRGIEGGEIIVHGDVGNETGSGMRRGLIAVGGDSGDFTGVNMLAGTIVVLGRLGQRSGAGMKRGSIISTSDAEILPTFRYSCSYRPVFLRLCLLKLQEAGLPVEDAHIAGAYRRWWGDAVEYNKGELLLYQA